MNKAISWIVLLLGVYQILSLLIASVPAVLEGVWGWVVGVILLVVGIVLLKQP